MLVKSVYACAGGALTACGRRYGPIMGTANRRATGGGCSWRNAGIVAASAAAFRCVSR
jgi:hypothetical protein